MNLRLPSLALEVYELGVVRVLCNGAGRDSTVESG
jgi:hypothetical protein